MTFFAIFVVWLIASSVIFFSPVYGLPNARTQGGEFTSVRWRLLLAFKNLCEINFYSFTFYHFFMKQFLSFFINQKNTSSIWLYRPHSFNAGIN